MILATLLFSMMSSGIRALDNGLALTPPMGWMTWQRFGCITDCETYPNDCISERLIHNIADLMVSDGYLRAGYKYIVVDDCWSEKKRDSANRLQPDRRRFPSGIKKLASYVHSRGLKFGIYGDYGTHTCAGYPGSLYHLKTDAETFAEWGVDYLKLDGCNSNVNGMEKGYAEMGLYLNQTGRPIVYSCSFPAYKGLSADYEAAVRTCNLWRNYNDIEDSWRSVRDITKWFADNQAAIVDFAGPGHWNDPDMLVIGNYGLSLTQAQAQMTIWAILAAPLLMSADLSTIEPSHRDVLLNSEAISINQDRLGVQGWRVLTEYDFDFWTKPLEPLNNLEQFAIGIVNNRIGGYPVRIEFTLNKLGLTYNNTYYIKNVFEPNNSVTMVKPNTKIQMYVKPLGGILLRAIPVLSS